MKIIEEKFRPLGSKEEKLEAVIVILKLAILVLACLILVVILMSVVKV